MDRELACLLTAASEISSLTDPTYAEAQGGSRELRDGDTLDLRLGGVEGGAGSTHTRDEYGVREAEAGVGDNETARGDLIVRRAGGGGGIGGHDDPPDWEENHGGDHSSSSSWTWFFEARTSQQSSNGQRNVQWPSALSENLMSER